MYVRVYRAGRCGHPAKTHDPYVTGSGQSHNINVAHAACAKLRGARYVAVLLLCTYCRARSS